MPSLDSSFSGEKSTGSDSRMVRAMKAARTLGTRWPLPAQPWAMSVTMSSISSIVVLLPF